MSSRERAETCKHSTGRVGNVAVFTLPTCPYMHMLKDKIVTTRSAAKTAGFMKRGKIRDDRKKQRRLSRSNSQQSNPGSRPYATAYI